MNTYNNISRELKACFNSISIFKVLLPLNVVFLFGGLIIFFIINVLGVQMGGLINNIAYWAFILGLFLTYANLNNRLLFIGIWGYAATCLLIFFKLLFGYEPSFSWDSLFRTIIFGGLGYLVFKQSVTNRS